MSDVYEKLMEFIQDLKLKELANMRINIPQTSLSQASIPLAPTINHPKVFKFEPKDPKKKSSKRFEAIKYSF